MERKSPHEGGDVLKLLLGKDEGEERSEEEEEESAAVEIASWHNLGGKEGCLWVCRWERERDRTGEEFRYRVAEGGRGRLYG